MPTSSEPALSVAAFVAQAVTEPNVFSAGGVPSTGELVATPVKLEPAMLRPPGAEAERVTVIVVPEARPEGACADTIAQLEPLAPSPPCLSTVQVNEPPETELIVGRLKLNQPTLRTMNPPAATAFVVVREIVLDAESIADEPIVNWSMAILTAYGIAIFVPFGTAASALASACFQDRAFWPSWITAA